MLDTFTKEKTFTPVEPVTHHYVYDRTAKTLLCSDEGCTEAAPAEYTGWAKDSASGKDMYFIGGKFLTDWFTLGEVIYHFDATTGEAHAVTVVEDIKTTCGVRGHKTVRCECGETYTMEYANAAGHVNKPATAADGSTYYVCSRCGRISLYDLPFMDVEDSDWFAKYVDYVYHNGLFNGKSEMIFDPNTAMTRGEFVTVLWRIAGRPEFDNVNQTVFVDCETNVWYTAAVNWAAKNKIVNGVDDTHFELDVVVTREQIVTILHRYAKFIGMDNTAQADLTKDFVDGALVSEYAEKAVAWAAAAKLLQGDEQRRINPQGKATRAEVATLIARFNAMLDPQEP